MEDFLPPIRCDRQDTKLGIIDGCTQYPLYGSSTLDKKLDLLRLNSMRKYVANTKHYICAHIYIDVNIQYIYANICNIFTAYVKVTTYLPTYVHYICARCKYIICLPTSLQHVCYLKAL